jgi:hypothetical protein
VAAAHAPDRLEPRPLGGRPRGVSARAQLVEAAQRERGDGGPDPQRAVELAAGDPLEQRARNRQVGLGRPDNRRAIDLNLQRYLSLSSVAIPGAP